jgi:CubicO group peptidase (beta-lactamase class C family)
VDLDRVHLVCLHRRDDDDRLRMGVQLATRRPRPHDAVRRGRPRHPRGAIEARVFPAAVAEVGASAGVLWRDAFGRLTFDAESATTTSTPFDLASLTKVLATTSVVMDLDEQRARCAWRDRLRSVSANGAVTDRESVTVRDLLEHRVRAAGRARRRAASGRREIRARDLQHAARVRSRGRARSTAIWGSSCSGFLPGSGGRVVARSSTREVR